MIILLSLLTSAIFGFNSAQKNEKPECIKALKERGYNFDSRTSDTSVKAYIGFVVNSIGLVEDVKVLQSSGSRVLDEAAMCNVREMTPFKPAKKDGKNVSTKFTLPVQFPLDKKSYGLYKSERDLIAKQNQFYNEGVKTFGNKQFNMALENYEKALEISPEDIDALYNAGATCIELDNTTKACEFWSRIKLLGKNDADDLIKKYCSPISSEVLDTAEKMPSFVGGAVELIRYLKFSLVYPQKAKEDDVSGTTNVDCIVENDGTVTNIAIGNSSGSDLLDNEALRVIKAMPKWIPGMQSGRFVRVRVSLPIKFQLK